MKRVPGLLLLTSCVTSNVNPTPPQHSNIFQLGEVERSLVSGTTVDIREEGWQDAKVDCITHLYRCDIDANGKVSGLKALDISSPMFQNLTEDALREWEFEPGKAARCFVQYAYEQDQEARIFILPETLALQMADNLANNRAELPTSDNKVRPTCLKQPKPEMPRNAALRGIEGFAVYHFEIDDEGIPKDPVLLRSYPKGVFETSALQALRRWRYSRLQDEPDSARYSTVTMSYHLVEQNHISTCDYGFERHKLAGKASAVTP